MVKARSAAWFPAAGGYCYSYRNQPTRWILPSFSRSNNSRCLNSKKWRQRQHLLQFKHKAAAHYSPYNIQMNWTNSNANSWLFSMTAFASFKYISHGSSSIQQVQYNTRIISTRITSNRSSLQQQHNLETKVRSIFKQSKTHGISRSMWSKNRSQASPCSHHLLPVHHVGTSFTCMCTYPH